MKTPRGKKRVPNGYRTYPIVPDQSLSFLGSLCPDLSVSIASAGDVKILYEMVVMRWKCLLEELRTQVMATQTESVSCECALIEALQRWYEMNQVDILFQYIVLYIIGRPGFYGKGSHSKNEPVFADIANADDETVAHHLNRIGMDRYVMRQRDDSLKYMNSGRSIRVDPSQFLHNLSEDVNFEANSDMDDNNEPSVLSPSNEMIDDSSFLQSDVKIKSTHPEASEQSSIQPAPTGPQPAAEADPWAEEDAEFWASDQIPETPDLRKMETHGADGFHGDDSSWSTITLPALEEKLEGGDHPETTNAQPLDPSEYNEDEDLTETSSDDDLDLDRLRIRGEYEESDITRSSHKDSKYSQISETLILTAYEALFLMLSFNCLVVPHRMDEEEEKELDADTLWEMAVERDPKFIVQYAVYHHIRAKGWVAKDGLTYGCDFMVYKAGPRYYHSTIGVLTRAVDADTLKEISMLNPRRLSWTSMMGVNRVLTNVRKELMIIYALLPKDLQYIDTNTSTLPERYKSVAECLRDVKLCEVLCNRIVPSRERE